MTCFYSYLKGVSVSSECSVSYCFQNLRRQTCWVVRAEVGSPWPTGGWPGSSWGLSSSNAGYMRDGAVGASSLRCRQTADRFKRQSRRSLFWCLKQLSIILGCFYVLSVIVITVVGLNVTICASDCPACCVRASRSALQPHRASIWEVSCPAAATVDVWRAVHLL